MTTLKPKNTLHDDNKTVFFFLNNNHSKTHNYKSFHVRNKV